VSRAYGAVDRGVIGAFVKMRDGKIKKDTVCG